MQTVSDQCQAKEVVLTMTAAQSAAQISGQYYLDGLDSILYLEQTSFWAEGVDTSIIFASG